MKEFPQNIKFKYNWRTYQKRVLDELETHLSDNHLNIIAPPGSGKTVLGLEVALRLNKPTLIFAPTIAIKNQWIQRFCELFLQTEEKPDWISDNIKNPGFLTVSTYQALHAACSNIEITGEDEINEESDAIEKQFTSIKKIDVDNIVKLLKDQNVGTIVVDEAHHLKNEWWKSLTAIKDKLKPSIVGLTATPPYDVSFTEWQHYINLNGPVDAEISVPELVVENDLCPHQDYVFLSEPTEEENRAIKDLRQKANKIFDEIKNDKILKKAISQHPVFAFPNQYLDWIYNNLEYYSSILIFLNATGVIITEKHLEIVGDKKFKVPELSFEWMEKLLTFYLYIDSESFVNFEEHKEKLLNKLSRNGILERKTICFSHNQRINKFLSSSLSKLHSIDRIVDVEHNTLKDSLRMVILTDYIRKEFLVTDGENNLELNKIGVMPIFEQLRRTNDRKLSMGVLSGSLVIIPAKALESLNKLAQRKQINEISYTVLPYDPNYLIINTNEQIKHIIVQLITQIFEQGEILILIGTKSLLGEGWDAPSINSLILASFVGSFVLSNQMRGRAIRSQRNNPEKTGNIWHLVCVDRTSEAGGDDIDLLKRRFKGFVGVSIGEEISIENGINRLNIPEKGFSVADLENYNLRTETLAGQRQLLKQRWNEALKRGAVLTEEIRIPFPEDQNYQEIKSLYFNRTIANLLAVLSSTFLIFGQEVIGGVLRTFQIIKSPEDFLNLIIIIGIISLIVFGRMLFKALRLLIKYRDISKDFHQIGLALLETLINTGTIKTNYQNLHVISSVDSTGAIYCHLEGGTTFEKSTFLKSLHEIIGTINNPRYIIIRKNSFLKIFSQKDYHSVPEIIGSNKKNAEYFSQQWRRLVSLCELVYTRTIEGRKLLLKSRIESLSSQFEDKTERINKWR